MATRLSISTQAPGSFQFVDPFKLHLDEARYNVRRIPVSDEKVRELAISIIRQGQENPITIRKIADNIYTVVSGTTRLRAILLINTDAELRELAGLESDAIFSIRCITVTANDREAWLKGIAENLNRNEPSPIDNAHAQRRMREFGMSEKEIADFFKCTEARLSQLSNLLNLSDEQQLLIHNKYLTINNGVQLSYLMPDKRDEVLQAATKPKLEPTGAIIGIDGVDFDEVERKGLEAAALAQEQEEKSKPEPIIEIDNQQLAKEIAKARGKQAWRSYKEIKETLREVADNENHTPDARTLCQAIYDWMAGEDEIDDLLDCIERINLVNS
jgi:ParB/RepB/Spo0J family partition protein